MKPAIQTLRRKTGARLRNAILKDGLPISRVASCVGRSEETVRDWLTGELDPPSTVLESIESLIRSYAN